MIDRLLSAGSAFDWISPLVALFNDATNGPSHTFLLPAGCGRSGIDIEHLLRSRGIKTWGLMMINDTTMITVAKTQAGWAQHLLNQQDIPVENPFFTRPASKATSTEEVTQQDRGLARSDSGDLIDRIGDRIDSLLGS